nr:hypothetical protein GCM10020185_52840 [Pseudomonas brassicacearum subsp. brassicacearum]
MSLSVFDLFKIGIGPSSSHTVGPMRAAARFAEGLRRDDLLNCTTSVKVELYGSLGATGKGHGSDKAVLLGLEGEHPDTVDTETVDARLQAIRSSGRLNLLGEHSIEFNEKLHLAMIRKPLAFHPNGMIFRAFDAAGLQVRSREYYSVGGGFVVDEDAAGADRIVEDATPLTFPFKSAKDLLGHCSTYGLSISQVMLTNESAWRPEAETRAGLLKIWQVMQDCVAAGCRNEGILPGGLKVKRRAAALHRQLCKNPEAALRDPLSVLDWVNLYALAVNEEKRLWRARRHRTHQRGGGDHPGRAALLHALYPRGQRGWRGAFPADRRRHRHPVQGKTPPSPALKSVARVKWAWPVPWPPAPSAKCSAAACSKWKTPPRSAWNTTSA